MIKKHNILINGIYQHYKGSYYRVTEICYHHENNHKAVVCYFKCDINGIYQSIRDEKDNIIGNQPFYRELEQFFELVDIIGIKVQRFKFVKLCL